MRFTDERRLSPAARALRRRILDVLPAGGYQLDRLFLLFDIEVTTAVPSAAVTTGGSPRLRINPDFVARFCATDEALFVLVLHELLHVVLGHTRLFPRASWAHNVAFDAVINAMIARTHPHAEFLALLTSVNGWHRFPGRLLRPAPGWPRRPEPLPADASERERSIHARLYGDDSGDVTYHEIFGLLGALLHDAGPGAGPAQVPVLLGGHAGCDGQDGGEELAVDPTLREVLEGLVATWPAPFRAAMRDRGTAGHELSLAPDRAADRAIERALAEVFAQAGCLAQGRQRQRPVRRPVASTSISVLPQLGDRRAATRAAVLGRRPIFWEAPHERTVRDREPAPRAFVYLDVSGSMDPFLPALRAAIAAPVRDGAARLFAFSTEVHEVGLRRFARATARTTGGTDVNAVLEHLLGLPPRERPRAIVLITDGFVGAPRQDLADALRTHRIAVHVALAPSGRQQDLAAIAARFHALPAPDRPEPPAPAGRHQPARPRRIPA
ncbi:MAG: VWA domain-containing protein [Planctomycetes bacterium]|nr:VWA domain-containing protein [Planctomycetota bacterium]